MSDAGGVVSESILGCPFCGSPDVSLVVGTRVYGDWPYARCNGCDAQGPLRPKGAEAIRAWNAAPRGGSAPEPEEES